MKITFLGGGNMAAALIGGLIQHEFHPVNLQVIEVQETQRQKLEHAHGIRCHATVEPQALTSDVIVLAVKPQQMQEALAPLAGQLQHQIVLSIAAGLPLQVLSGWLGGYKRLIRAMPNTPALVGVGMTGLYALPEVNLNERLAAEQILQTTGRILWVQDETRMDALTAISGSGPAYLFLFIEALQQAALEMGFSPEDAALLATQTCLGAAQLAARSDQSASTLRQQVTSKGGTTEAALRIMAEKGVPEGIIAGAQAARIRGQELAKELGGT